MQKVVSIYALGQTDPNMPQDAVDRAGFQKLVDQLMTLEQRGQAGKLGEYTIKDDGTVLLGDPTVFNKDNIDKFNF